MRSNALVAASLQTPASILRGLSSDEVRGRCVLQAAAGVAAGRCTPAGEAGASVVLASHNRANGPAFVLALVGAALILIAVIGSVVLRDRRRRAPDSF